MLRDYEILYIVRPELDEDQLGQAIKAVTGVIENLGGTHQKTDIWGRRRLAYEVRHLREGQYVLSDFQIEPARVPELEATLKISETVFRHLIVRKPEPRAARPRPAAAAPAPAEASAEPGSEAAAEPAASPPEGPAATGSHGEPAPATEPAPAGVHEEKP